MDYNVTQKMATQSKRQKESTQTQRMRTSPPPPFLRMKENMFLGNDFQSGTTLDLVTSAFRLDDDAALRRVSRAASAMDQEAGAAAHVVGGCGVEIIAIWHPFELTHVAESVSSLGQWTHILLALAAGIVAAASRLATAAASGVDPGAVIACPRETMGRLGISVWSSCGDVQALCQQQSGSKEVNIKSSSERNGYREGDLFRWEELGVQGN
jgi:hypothetical protein